MVTFNRKFPKTLPYDRKKYIDFLENDNPTEWFGVSFQLPGGFEGREIGITEFLEKYETWFKNLITKLDSDSSWIVNHDDKDMDWFPNNDDNLPSLRALFKKYNIPNNFRGALLFPKDDLLEYTRDLLSYPTGVFSEDGLLYKDLDISHGELPVIIKINAHWCIDILSTDKDWLRETLNKNNVQFIARIFRSASL